jgi:signal transduction histidine kinase
VAKLQMELARDDGGTQHLRRAENALDRMEQLIEDMLALARQGSTVGETELVRVEGLVSQCWSHVEAESARLTVEVGGAIRADRSRLANLLENLFANAVDHGGEEVLITVGRLTEDNGIYVADNGPGIPADASEQVFDSGYSTSEDGTGFGLAIAKRIVDAHGWSIEVTDSANGGARFEITGMDFVE